MIQVVTVVSESLVYIHDGVDVWKSSACDGRIDTELLRAFLLATLRVY